MTQGITDRYWRAEARSEETKRPLTDGFARNIVQMKRRNRILLVDDEEAILKIIKIRLRVLDYEVLTATDGDQALKLIKTSRPDVVLLDIIMPGTDGFQVLTSLKSLQYVPVIAFSARPENREKALTLGAQCFIAKPFNIDRLIDEIQKVLADHRE